MSKSRKFTEQIYLGADFDENTKLYHHRHTNRSVDENLMSAGHRGFSKLSSSSGDIGGAFEAYGVRQIVFPSSSVSIRHLPTVIYRGMFAAGMPPAGSVSFKDLYFYGSEAFAKMKPTKPSFDVGTAIGELKDLPSSIVQLRDRFRQLRGLYGHRHDWRHFRRAALARDASKDYLATVFGWVPLVRDCISLVDATKKTGRRTEWLLRNNGKPVRTRATLLTSETSDLLESGNQWGALSPVLSTAAYAGIPYYDVTLERSERVWASARMRYHLPESMASPEFSSRLERSLYGDVINLNTVYQLMPWSWMIDWFSNVGDMIQNLDAGVADRLACDYSYCMRTVEDKRIRYGLAELRTNRGLTGSTNVRVNAISTNTAFRKTRMHISPFGLAFRTNELSLMQTSILGALGLSRVP